MRKIICMMVAIILCLGLAVPTYASESGFVPSITYKPTPDIVPVTGEDGGKCDMALMEKALALTLQEFPAAN